MNGTCTRDAGRITKGVKGQNYLYPTQTTPSFSEAIIKNE